MGGSGGGGGFGGLLPGLSFLQIKIKRNLAPNILKMAAPMF